MASKNDITYKTLINGDKYNAEDIDCLEVQLLLDQARNIPQLLFPFKGVSHIIDYTKMKHVAVGGDYKHFLGHHPNTILENGLGFIIDIFQKDDFGIYNAKIFPIISGFLKKIPQSRHSDYIFSFSYRTTRKDGKIIHVHQQGSYITSPKTNLPLYGIGLVTDISPIVKDTCMHFAIDQKISNGNSFEYKQIQTEYFYPNHEESWLTKREKEILGRLAEGFSSKQIADKLYITESTIVNHRKSMLKKTNTKNVAELIAFGIRNHII